MGWVKWNQLLDSRLLNFAAVPNGAHYAGNAKMRAIQAAKRKAEGLSPGYPDLLLDYPAGKFHGLRIEMKKPGGVISAEQRTWLARLNLNGYYAVTVDSFEAFVKTVTEYLAYDTKGKENGDNTK